jgi:hypothetical protein
LIFSDLLLIFFDIIWPTFLFWHTYLNFWLGYNKCDAELNFDIRLPSDIFDIAWSSFLHFDVQSWNLDQRCNSSYWIEYQYQKTYIWHFLYRLTYFFGFDIQTWNLEQLRNFWCWIEFWYQLAYFWYCLRYFHLFLDVLLCDYIECIKIKTLKKLLFKTVTFKRLHLTYFACDINVFLLTKVIKD